MATDIHPQDTVSRPTREDASDIQKRIFDIKKELRAAMNGIASAKIREAGAPYKIIFGVELPRLMEIAREFEPNHQLAQQLWNEHVRESKLLATMLMPLDNFYEEIADIWVEEIPTDEVAQIAVMNLFSRLPYAPSKAFEWIASDNNTKQLCGFLIIARLLMQGAEFNERAIDELNDQMQAVPQDAPLALRKAIMAIENKIQAFNG